MKPLLTAATLVLSIAAVSGSSPASAETFFAEGIKFSTGMYGASFYFSDSRLDTESYWPSEPHFAYLTKEYEIWTHPPWSATYSFYASINSDNPYICNSNTILGKTTVDGVPGFTFGGNSVYNFTTESGETFSYNDPVAILSEFSIFDFEQSFVYYNNNEKTSLAQILRERKGDFYLDTSGDRYELRMWFWSSDQFDQYIINDISLAYNLPVPEPETWAMLLTGLGIVSVVTRRQRARAAM